MSDSEVRYNLLKPSCFTPSRTPRTTLGADGWVYGADYDSRNWGAKAAEWAVELPAGAYALLYEVDGKQGEVWDGLGVYVGEDRVGVLSHHDGPYSRAMSIKLNAESNVSIMVKCYAPARYRLMLVEGDTPAAWAPAKGETLTGGGALMSANLLDGVKPEITQCGSMADGVLTSTESKDAWQDVATWPITADTLAENQTVHIGLSAKWHGAAATTGTAWACIKYADASGYTNSVQVKIDGIATEWKRLSLSAVVPSGMRIVDFHISADHIDAAFDATSLVLSYGSPVVLASAEHTRGDIVRVPLSVCDGIVSMHVSACPLSIEIQAIIH
jgi:hypothetical protein